MAPTCNVPGVLIKGEILLSLMSKRALKKCTIKNSLALRIHNSGVSAILHCIYLLKMQSLA